MIYRSKTHATLGNVRGRGPAAVHEVCPAWVGSRGARQFLNDISYLILLKAFIIKVNEIYFFSSSCESSVKPSELLAV